jgi:hypothetical protein
MKLSSLRKWEEFYHIRLLVTIGLGPPFDSTKAIEINDNLTSNENMT